GTGGQEQSRASARRGRIRRPRTADRRRRTENGGGTTPRAAVNLVISSSGYLVIDWDIFELARAVPTERPKIARNSRASPCSRSLNEGVPRRRACGAVIGGDRLRIWPIDGRRRLQW